VKKIKQERVLYIVARIGGWDGIALQATHWLEIFLKMGKEVTLVTGEIEDGGGTLNEYPYNKINIVQIPEMSLAYQGKLYKSSFKGKYHQEEWISTFVEQKAKIKKELQHELEDIGTVFMHNTSIKHMIPSLWAASFELIKEYPERQFITLDADSPYERGEIVEDFAEDVLHILGKPKVWHKKGAARIAQSLKSLQEEVAVLPGPDVAENLFHIVLNTYQEKVGHNIYGIKHENLTAIPDIAPFCPRCVNPKTTKTKKDQLFEVMSKHQVANAKRALNESCAYIVSPVRTVERKKLKEVVFFGKMYEHYLRLQKSKSKVVLVLTHPNGDGQAYYDEVVEYAKKLKVTVVFMGEVLKLRKKTNNDEIVTYEEMMRFLSGIKSVCVVGSAAGGWENGILEATLFQMPACVNPHLPSYSDMTAFGYDYIPGHFTILHDFMSTGMSKSYLKLPSIDTMCSSIYAAMFDQDTRHKSTTHNYKVGFKKQSEESAKKRMEKIMNQTHGHSAK